MDSPHLIAQDISFANRLIGLAVIAFAVLVAGKILYNCVARIHNSRFARNRRSMRAWR